MSYEKYRATRKYFYEDFDDTEFYSVGMDLYRRTEHGDVKFFSVDPKDSEKDEDRAYICWVREHENYAVILITWSIRGNVFVYDKAANKLLYRLHDPKNVFSDRPNSWIAIHTGPHQDIDEGCFAAISVDKYYEVIRLSDGEVIKAVDRRSNDPRDF